MQHTCSQLAYMEEASLIDRVKAGERDLFERLITPYARGMYILAYSVLRDRHEAEDASQESVLKALIRLDQLRHNASFKGWLMQIVLNESRMRRRRSSRHTCSLDEDRNSAEGQWPVLPEPADSRDNPEQALDRKERQSAMHRAYNNLPDKYQTILRLRCAESFSLSTIGAMLDLSIPAVKTRLHRARLLLRTQLCLVLHTREAKAERMERPSM